MKNSEKCDQNATEMRPSFISDHSGGANKMVDVRGKDNNVSTNIDLEAWEPCEECRCREMAYAWIRIGRLYCGYCGRPLTPEARAMLEKRLRG